MILALQAVLSLCLRNSAFQDEALYIYAGHMEIAHLFHGAPVTVRYSSYFSGSPVLYPVVAGALDGVFGLAGPRALSLVLMLGCTVLLYAVTRRLFGARAAHWAAALFAVTQSTIVLGWFATYDSAALFLLALSVWLVVRADRMHPLVVLLVAPVLLLAFCTKYASGMFVPTVLVLAVLTAWPHRGPRALWRGALLLGALALLLFGTLALNGDLLTGIEATTTNRVHGTDGALHLVELSLQWSGMVLAVACWGAFCFVRRGGENEGDGLGGAGSGAGRAWRVALCTALVGTGLLAPAYQVHLSTLVSLYKHVGFGLFFLAPVAGYGMGRLAGPRLLRVTLAAAVLAVNLYAGFTQAEDRFATWPDSTKLVAALQGRVSTTGRYLADSADVPIYYLRGITRTSQWSNTYSLSFVDRGGVRHTGVEAYSSAVEQGRFDLIVLSRGSGARANDQAVITALAESHRYRLAQVLPFTSGKGRFEVWVRS